MKNDRKLVTYLICVCIATIFWFLNALNKQYTVELTFPVKYTNLPKNKVLASDPPDHFILKVNSFGFTILRHKLSMAFSPLVFNVNELTGKKMETSNKSSYAIPMQQFIGRLSSQVSNELEITGIQPDTLHFNFDRIVQRKVRVKPNVSFELKKQHYLDQAVTTKPDSVLVSGPESILDTLKFINTTRQHYKELDQTILRNVLLEENKVLIIEPKRVVLKIPVEEFTEKQVMVPVTIDKLPENVHINLFPAKISISFMIPLSSFSEVKPSDFKASVSFQEIQEKKDLLNIKIEVQPSGLRSVKISPKQVEYLIEK